MKHFLDLKDISSSDLLFLIHSAKSIKRKKKVGTSLEHVADGKNLIMIFEKPSTRTRISFEVGINQLGGNALLMNFHDSQLSKGETISDTAKVISSMVDLVMIRCKSHENLIEFAQHSSVPVINGLTGYSHPCQIMASIMSIEEKLDDSIDGKKICWSGDANNVLMSYIHGAPKFNYKLFIATPKEYIIPFIDEIKAANQIKQNIFYSEDPKKAVSNVDVVVTDTWISMGQEKNKEDKIKALKPYQVNKELMKLAGEKALFTHCLPAYRGMEVTSDVIDSEQSIVYLEANNRLYSQKAVMKWLLKKNT